MTRSELAKAIQARFRAKGYSLKRAEALDLLDETISIIKDGLIAGRKVPLNGLGILKVHFEPRGLELRIAPSKSFREDFKTW